MTTPHKHAACIIAWAGGARIAGCPTEECAKRIHRDCGWTEFENPAWHLDWEYMVMPEREYPKSSLTVPEMCEAFRGIGYPDAGLKAVADAAVKRYIQDQEAGK